jgi:hypothetical protein
LTVTLKSLFIGLRFMSHKTASDVRAKKKHEKKASDLQGTSESQRKTGITIVSKVSKSTIQASENVPQEETSEMQWVVETQKNKSGIVHPDTFQEARKELIAEVQLKKRRNSDPLLGSLETLNFSTISSSTLSKTTAISGTTSEQDRSPRKHRTSKESPRPGGHSTTASKKAPSRTGTSPDERRYLPSDEEVFDSSPDTLSPLHQFTDEISKEELSWGSSLSTEESSLLSSIDLKDDNDSESELDPREVDSVGLFKIDNPEFNSDPIAENAVIWKELHGVKYIKAATPAALIHMLADASAYSDKDFIDTFLLTYEYWTDAVTVLKLLYNQYVSPKIRTKTSKIDNEETLRLWIQLRVINVLKKWIELKYNELRKHKLWQNTLTRFLRYLANRSEKERSWAAHLKKLMKQHSEVLKMKIKGSQNLNTSSRSAGEMTGFSLSTRNITSSCSNNPTDSSTSTNVATGSSPTKLSTQQISMSQKVLNEYSVKDIARQMCLMDYNLFKSIKLSEYYRKQFEKEALKMDQLSSSDKENKQTESSNLNKKEKEQKHQSSSNIMKATERFNQVTYWVATEIVLAPNIKQRVKYLTKFIHIMEELRQEKDFNGLMQIYSALHFSYVTRLKKSWRELDIRTQNIFKTIQQLMSTSHNYKLYRQMLDSLQPPGVPIQGLILNDLVYIEELRDREGENNEYVNWEKMSMLAKVFSLVLKFQKLPYTFDEIPALSSFFSDLPNQARILSETELQERSATAEKDEELVSGNKFDSKATTKALFKTPTKEKTKSRSKIGHPLQLSDIWEDKTLYEKFKHYLVGTHNIENLLFYEEVEKFKQNPTVDKARQIVNTYLNEESHHYVSSLDPDTVTRIRNEVKDSNVSLELFDDAQKEVEMQVLNISFTNFLQEKSSKV